MDFKKEIPKKLLIQKKLGNVVTFDA